MRYVALPRMSLSGLKSSTKAAAASLNVSISADIETFKEAAAALVDDFKPLSDMRGSATYRMATAQNLLVKYGLELSEGKTARLAGAGLATVMERW